MAYTPLVVKVWGDHACFTRPEMKVERVSYPVMTPSAARGALEAIFWKPEFVWRIKEIHILNPIKTFSIMRNEVNTRMSPRVDGICITDNRAQRHTLGLRDVAYLIYADIELRPDVTDDIAKYRDQFRRRVQKGQCYHNPYLGFREFAAAFSETDGNEIPITLSENLGNMLLDIEHCSDGKRVPHYFEAEIIDGIMKVPTYEFLKAGGGIR